MTQDEAQNIHEELDIETENHYAGCVCSCETDICEFMMKQLVDKRLCY